MVLVGWFGVLKLQRDIYGNPISEEEEEKITSPSENLGNEEEYPISPYASVEYGKKTLPAVEGLKEPYYKKPKESVQHTLDVLPKEKQTATETALSDDDSGTDAGSDVYNTNEALTIMRNRLMRPIQGNNSSKVARLLELTTLAAVDEQNRKKFLPKMNELIRTMR